jgi:hypothetical protein
VVHARPAFPRVLLAEPQIILKVWMKLADVMTKARCAGEFACAEPGAKPARDERNGMEMVDETVSNVTSVRGVRVVHDA